MKRKFQDQQVIRKSKRRKLDHETCQYIAKQRPDLFACAKNQLDRFIGQGSITITDLVLDTWPVYHLNKLLENKCPGTLLSCPDVASNNYGIPTPNLLADVIKGGEFFASSPKNTRFPRPDSPWKIPGQCHVNSHALFHYLTKRTNKRGKLSTISLESGAALSEDGFWYLHSWIKIEQESQIVLIETTCPRLVYFGTSRKKENAKYNVEMFQDHF